MSAEKQNSDSLLYAKYKTDSKDLNKFKNKILKIFIDEFESNINNILTISESELMMIIEKRLFLIFQDEYSSEILENDDFNKILKDCERIIYDCFFTPIKKILKNKLAVHEDNLKNSKNKLPPHIYIRDNFLKHCTGCEDIAYHKCGGKLIPVYTNYNTLTQFKEKFTNSSLKEIECLNELTDLTIVICVKCFESHFSKDIQMFCTFCITKYNSSIIDRDDFNLPIATWDTYHCDAVVNDRMKCIQCKDEPFYLNLKNVYLFCKKCKFECNAEDISWKCFICSADFFSKPAIYNKCDFNKIKKAIFDSNLVKKEIVPSEFPCCKVDLAKTPLFHKKKCDGKLFEGKLFDQTIVVCQKCKAMNYYGKFIWTCPVCFKRFTLDKSSDPTDELQTHRKSDIDKKTGILISQRLSQNYQEKINKLNEDEGKKIKAVQFKRSERAKSGQGLELHDSEKNEENIYEVSNGISMLRYSKIGIGNSNDKNVNSKNEEKKTGNLDNSNNHEALDLNKTCLKKKKSDVKEFEVKRPNDNQTKRDRKTEEIEIKDFLNPFKSKKEEIHRLNSISNVKTFEETKRKTQLNTTPNRVFQNQDDIQGFNLNINLNFDKNSKSIIEGVEQKEIVQDKPTFEKLEKQNKSEGSIPYFKVEDFKIVHQIGEGSFGCIYLAINPKEEKYAIKKIIIREKDKIDYIINEFEIAFNLRHPNILPIYGKSLRKLDNSTKVLYVLMELGHCDWKKDISNRAINVARYKENQLISILSNIANALAFLQTKGVAHRDIKPQNILLMKNKSVKISDFGCAKELDSNSFNTLRGTELFISPAQYEALKNNQEILEHNVFKSDVYSLGLCALYAATLSLESINELRNTLNPIYCFNLIKSYLKDQYSQKFINLVYRMLDLNEELRFDFIELAENLEKFNI